VQVLPHGQNIKQIFSSLCGVPILLLHACTITCHFQTVKTLGFLGAGPSPDPITFSTPRVKTKLQLGVQPAAQILTTPMVQVAIAVATIMGRYSEGSLTLSLSLSLTLTLSLLTLK